MNTEEQIREILLGMEWCHAVKTESLDEATAKINKLLVEARREEVMFLSGYGDKDPDGNPTHYIDMNTKGVNDRLTKLQDSLNNSDKENK